MLYLTRASLEVTCFFPTHLFFEDRGKKRKRNTFYFMLGEKGEVCKVKADSSFAMSMEDFFFGLLFGIFT